MICHMLIAQWRKPEKMIHLVFKLFLISIAVYSLLYATNSFFSAWLPEARSAVGFWNGILLEVLFFLNYMQCLYYFTRPVTLRILMEFLDHPESKVTRENLESKYSLNLMIESRLDLITLYGYCEKKGSLYSLTPKGKRFAGLLRLLRAFFKVPYYLQPREAASPS